ncbi:MAG: hypothetical protein AAF542_08190 [Pseudomonadota bacterium]
MKKVQLGICLLASLLLMQAYRISQDAGIFVEIRPLAYGHCEKLSGPPGSEDITIDRRQKVAFISAANGRAALQHYQDGTASALENGDIWLLDLSEKDGQPYPLNVDIDGRFHPHGIDLLTLDNGQRELYVVNHPFREQHEILIFDVGDNHRLSFRQRVKYPELISPNDITTLQQGQFLVTNDHGSPQTSFMARVEEYLGLSRSSVTYYDGSQGSFVIKGLKSANGITLSADQKMLYVAEAIGRKIKRFERGQSVREWLLVEELSVGTAVDNLEWRAEGSLLAGTHPKLFDFLGHAANVEHLSPSQVIEIDVRNSPMTFQNVYMNDGEELSGSSVATSYEGQLLIGAVFESHFLRCHED